ncbi:hypothetical protein O6H91_02G004800 [Diphasiastrum complanatum]|uniref:Uncharacterized protein n=1 Tax=Diphasiastrum complanatum TaxID=34168 RepID=A0ACC2ECH5_DIPCM|nr:hypothetical protein O6H91_02G004800 [Diphasiastrum complanatum]
MRAIKLPEPPGSSSSGMLEIFDRGISCVVRRAVLLLLCLDLHRHDHGGLHRHDHGGFHEVSIKQTLVDQYQTLSLYHCGSRLAKAVVDMRECKSPDAAYVSGWNCVTHAPSCVRFTTLQDANLRDPYVHI